MGGRFADGAVIAECLGGLAWEVGQTPGGNVHQPTDGSADYLDYG